LAREAIVCLEVVRVLELEFRVRGNLGEMKREVHPIVAPQKAAAPPTFAANVSFGSVQLSQTSYDHCSSTPVNIKVDSCISVAAAASQLSGCCSFASTQ